MYKYLVIFFVVSTIRAEKLYRKELFTLHQWTNLVTSLPMASNGNDTFTGITSNLLPVDVDIEYGDNGQHRTFLTVPRLGLGVPYSLAVISDNSVKLNPKLLPYPNLAWHIIEGNNCTGITSAIRTFIDECWRLWVVDSGQVNSLQLCPPQILAFDLINDVLVHRYALPPHIYIPGVSIFTALTVDLPTSTGKDKCLGGMIYIADAWGYGLIVYNAVASLAWRIEHELMRPVVDDVEKFSTPHAGIFTVSLSPPGVKNRQLYFHSLNSYDEVAVRLAVINNASVWIKTPRATVALESFRIIGTRGTQCESEAMDSAGNLYCSLMGFGALVSWQESMNYTADDLRAVVYNPGQFKFVTGLKVNKNANGDEELWALSSEPKLFIGAKAHRNGSTPEIKFEIIGCRVKNLQHNEDCTVGVLKSKFNL